MAEGARRVLGSDVGLSITGVAGPTDRTASRRAPCSSASPPQDVRHKRSGSTCRATATGSGDYATIAALDLLRRWVSGTPPRDRGSSQEP